MESNVRTPEPVAGVMRLVDVQEELPPPPPPPPERPPEIPQTTSEAIAETMIETDIPPVQSVVAAGTILHHAPVVEEYFRMHEVSEPPRFDENQIAADLVYPPIALRTGIEGRVILELFVDRNGVVQRVDILREEPPERGFGAAAIRAFMGRKGSPAMANGVPVSSRYRWPVSFRIR